MKLLVKLDMVSVAIDFACDQNAFDFAFELARAAAKERLSDVHLKHAMHLEDEGAFREAEDEFVRTNGFQCMHAALVPMLLLLPSNLLIHVFRFL